MQVYSHGGNGWKLFTALIFHSTGTFLSLRSTRLGEPPPVSPLYWSREDLLNACHVTTGLIAIGKRLIKLVLMLPSTQWGSQQQAFH